VEVGPYFPFLSESKFSWSIWNRRADGYIASDTSKLFGSFSFQELKALVAQHNASASQQPVSLPSSQSQRKYNLEKVFVVSQTGNCRVMAYCDTLSCLVVSQPSPQSTLIPGT